MLRRIVALCLLLAWPAVSPAFTFHVPEEHGRIQAAINLASTSQVDTILIAPGTYNERLSIQLKAVVLRGRNGAEATTIDGQLGGNVITLNGVGRNCIIEDLTITGGDQSGPDSVGTAIYLNSYASPTIQRCRLVGNRARAGGGINAYVFCEPLVKDCLIANNSGGSWDTTRRSRAF